jgi:O-antigen ligase
MFLEKLSQNIMSFRQNIILGIFLLLIVISSFFSGEWNNWLVAVILILAFPLVFYTLLLRRDQHPELDKRINLRSPFLYLLIFLLVGAVTSIFSVMKYNSSHYLVLLIAYGVIFWSASTVFRNFSKVKIVAWAIFFVGLLAVLISIFLFLKDSPERTEGLLRNANALGSYLLFSVPVGIVLALEAKRKKQKYLLGAGTALIVLAFFLTFSLTAWISFLIPLALLDFYYRKRLFSKRNISIFVILLFVILITAMAVRYSSSRDFGKALNLQETISGFHLNYSFVQRWNFLQSALDIFIKNPLAGTGLATYQQVYPLHSFSILEQPRYAHNYYLQTAAEIGLVGFVFFIGFIVSLSAVVYRVAKKFLPDDDKRPYLLGLALGLVGSCLHSLFDLFRRCLSGKGIKEN